MDVEYFPRVGGVASAAIVCIISKIIGAGGEG